MNKYWYRFISFITLSKLRFALKQRMERCYSCGWFLHANLLGLTKGHFHSWGIDDTKIKKTYYLHDYCYFAKKLDGFNTIENGRFIKTKNVKNISEVLKI